MKTRAEQEETIRQYYNQEVAEEEQRLAGYPFELPSPWSFIRQYLPPAPRFWTRLVVPVAMRRPASLPDIT